MKKELESWPPIFTNIQFKMAAIELDPMFVKALKLLQSKSKDSGAKLKAMLDDAIAQRKGLKPNQAGDSDTKVSKIKADGDTKRKDAEKRGLDKSTKDNSEPEIKKSKLDSSSKQREKESRDKERERQRKEKEKKEESQRERERAEKEKKEKDDVSKQDAEIISDDDDPSQPIDADDFARDLGINCVVCRQFDVSSGNQLVECQECHSLYHQECHKPPVTGQDVSDPRFVWYCSRCTKSFKKMMTQKLVKPSKPITLSTSSIKDSTSSVTKSVKNESESGSQAFRRIDPKTIATPKEPGAAKGMVGLAGLAANLIKPRGETKLSSSLKKSDHKSDNTKSTSIKTEMKSCNSTKNVEIGTKASSSIKKTDVTSKSSTTTKDDQSKEGKKSEYSKTKPEEKKLHDSSLSKKEEKKEKSDVKWKEDKKSKSGSPGRGGSPSRDGGSSVSVTSSSKNINKQAMANLSMVTANKRLQMMKKKAQTKPQEKIVHIK